MHRRDFLLRSAALSVSGVARSTLGFAGAIASCTVRLDPTYVQGLIPDDFNGLNYETAQLTDPRFFSTENAALVGLVRRLGRQGVLRLGGNTSDLAVWRGNTSINVSRPYAVPRIPITKEAIRALAGFLDATGWSLIYGFNLGTGTPAQAAAEAIAVAAIVGAHRTVFQIGNEPDIFGPRLRSQVTWNFSVYLVEWLRFMRSVRSAVPGAVFAGPDTAEVNNVDWIVPFAEAAGREVRFLSGHYYAVGPPNSAQTTIGKLLAPDPRLQAELDVAARAASIAHRPVRMTETNSCYWGGKPGVSDVLASALWGGDFMLRLAAAGYCGVNFHGGASKALSTALGGGPLAAASSTQSRIDASSGSYSPIAGTDSIGFRPHPLFYGMLLAGQLCGGRLIGSSIQGDGSHEASVYAVRHGAGLRVALFNKSTTMSLRVALHPGVRMRGARLLRLTAPSPDSRADILFGGSSVGASGEWSPHEQVLPVVSDGFTQIKLPRASAALLLLEL